jgi:hypothetical protein
MLLLRKNIFEVLLLLFVLKVEDQPDVVLIIPNKKFINEIIGIV